MAELLIIDDEQAICWGLARLGASLGHATRTASSAEQGLLLAKQREPDVIVLDVRLPGIDGLTAMRRFRELTDAPIVLITAFGDIPTAVAAVEGGAHEYLLKPFELAEARLAIERALAKPAAETIAHSGDRQEMLGDSPAMQALYRQIALAAHAPSCVLLRGERGVGKELAARAIHQHSARSEGPFVVVNAAALDPTQAEADLFGWIDAEGRRHEGLLARARGGVLFLDEIADAAPPTQVKLLRAIEEQAVTPVGADKPTPTDFRAIAASHEDLAGLAQRGEFRRDLYLRISAFEVSVPPLRERTEDIPQLAACFAERLGGRPAAFAAETLQALRARTWPGNVRELRNAVEHAVVLARSGPIMPEHLPEADPSAAAGALPTPAGLSEALVQRVDELLDDPSCDGVVYERMLAELERPILSRALQRYDNEYAPAARALGLHRTTLKRKLG